jgi:3',5'-cyclic AMP phosphodiesterase CpdA
MLIAHISDPHLSPLPPVTSSQLMSKRLIGYINWQRNRKNSLTGSPLPRLIERLRGYKPDHVIVSGDLVNLALPDEFLQAKQWLDDLGSPEMVSMVPGNHDAYVRSGLHQIKQHWAPYFQSDTASPTQESGFPFYRVRGGVAIIGLSSAVATPPFFATGRIGSAQLIRLETLLNEARWANLRRLVVLHHPPHERATYWHKRLTDAEKFRAVIARAGADLILHGHTHQNSSALINGSAGPISVLGVASASAQPSDRHPGASFSLYDIRGRSIISMQRHILCDDNEFAASDWTPVSRATRVRSCSRSKR